MARVLLECDVEVDLADIDDDHIRDECEARKLHMDSEIPIEGRIPELCTELIEAGCPDEIVTELQEWARSPVTYAVAKWQHTSVS